MKRFLMLMLLIGATACSFAADAPDKGADYPDPARFERDVRQFEAEDAKSPPPAGAVLCIGSSSMRKWHPTIREDLKPLTVIPRGFGGSTMNDVLYFTDRIVLPYKPRAILLYEGDNDIAANVSPQQVRDTFDAFVEKVHKTLPKTRIYVICIKPSVARWNIWPQMKQANALLAQRCAQDDLLTYIDIASPMLNKRGMPRPRIFVDDKLHMNPKGYVIWTKTVRPVLVAAEEKYEH